jgi:hypothetical protein
MHSRCLFAPLATAAVAFALTAPASAHGDGAREKAFCLTLTHRAVRENARAGKWLDPVTRHDGVVVECEDKRIDFRRFTTLEPGRTSDAWRERTERDWKAAQCSNETSRQAMEKGWTIRATYTMASGENVSFNADECD